MSSHINAYALVITDECEHCHKLTSYEIPLTAPFDRRKGKPSGPGMSMRVELASEQDTQ
jgi:hypothetical protein